MSAPQSWFIPPFNPETADPAVAQAMALLPVERNLPKVLANSATFFQPFMQLTAASWAPTRTIRSSEWQVVVLRTASILDSDYEWQVNEPVARLFGFDDHALAKLREGDLSDKTIFSDRHRLVAKMTAELVTQHRLSPETAQASNRVLGPEGTVEVIVIHSVYALIANLSRSAGLVDDPPVAGLDAILRTYNAAAIEKENEQRAKDVSSGETI
ncbi:hypothetical protein ASPCADRAFT_210081 [Aspergillus carbonarius ITEM 5010]|uniref:Carboxymuconolactone decarboxylase-like domain-containing protein n=1 Tax=Aspergillus carbonarius (strain ITEM 5010) TaxID=602072 RepID=A0A1R3REB6_ASPC5|nr:hypothetical protein ASPCADRAFT_210081 [Aspergillus carbonarius ITEM 5010]